MQFTDRAQAKRMALRMMQDPVRVATHAIATLTLRPIEGDVHRGRTVKRAVLIDYWTKEGHQCQAIARRDTHGTVWWVPALEGWDNSVEDHRLPWRMLPSDEDVEDDLSATVHAIAGVFMYSTTEQLMYNALECLDAIERTAGFWFDSREEFIAKAWAPQRHVDWCLCTEEQRDLSNLTNVPV